MNRYSLFGIRATHYVSTCRLKEASTLQYSRATFSAFVIIASNILNGELFFINIFPGSASNIKEWCGTQSDFVTFFLFSRQTLFLSEYRDIWREHSNITSWLDISSTASQNIETESMQIQKFFFFLHASWMYCIPVEFEWKIRNQHNLASQARRLSTEWNSELYSS